MTPLKPKKIQTFNDLAGITSGKQKAMKMAKKKGDTIQPISPGILDKEGKSVKGINDTDFEYVNNAKDYNDAIYNIDSKFSKELSMENDYILVRAFMEIPRMIGQVAGKDLYAGRPYTAVPKKSGYDMMRIPKEFPYTNKAVVVNSNTDKYKAGEVVIIEPSLVIEVPLPGTERTYLASQFIHPDHNQMDENSGVGYILCKYYQIHAKINNQID